MYSLRDTFTSVIEPIKKIDEEDIKLKRLVKINDALIHTDQSLDECKNKLNIFEKINQNLIKSNADILKVPKLIKR